MSARTRSTQVWMLALFALFSVWTAPLVDTQADESIASILPPVSAPPLARTVTTEPDSRELAQVHAHLTRYARRGGLTPSDIDAIAEAIVTEAERHDLEPRLVLAVMHVESRYDPYAVSPVDAMGLMQILPSTGEWLAPKVGVAWAGPHTLFDPVANVRLGVAYLRMLSDRYDGRIHTALAAYNWGPGAIDRRLRNGATVPRVYPELVQHAYDRATRPARS